MEMFAAVENQFPSRISVARESTAIYLEFNCVAIRSPDCQQPYPRREGGQYFESVSAGGQSIRSHNEFERHCDHKFRGSGVISWDRRFRLPEISQTKTG